MICASCLTNLTTCLLGEITRLTARQKTETFAPSLGSLSLSLSDFVIIACQGSSFSEDKTLACSAGGTENDSTLEATLPKTLEPDTIPATPFTQSDDFQPLLKRSVDVKVDATRRTSAGNTLAFGLSTLESPNSTR